MPSSTLNSLHAVTTITLGSAPVSGWLPPLLMLMGVVVLGIILALLMRGRRAVPAASSKGAGATHTGQPAPSAGMDVLQQAEHTRQQIEDVRKRVGELVGTAQRLATRIDDKSERLRSLLQLVDQRIESFESAQAPEPSIISGPLAAERRQRPAVVSHVGPAPSPLAATESRPPTPSIPADRTLDVRTQAIYDLSDLGRDPVAIARELKEQVGAVELILALRNA